MNKKKHKNHREVTIPHYKELLSNTIRIAIFFAITLLMFSVFFIGDTSNCSVGVIIWILLLFCCSSLFFGYLFIAHILCFRDHITYSKQGIEYILHPFDCDFWYKEISGFIKWEEIEGYAIWEKEISPFRLYGYTHGRYSRYLITYLVLKLKDKEEPIKLSYETLQEGKPGIRHYVNLFSKCKYDPKYEHIWFKEVMAKYK